jgi:alkanesulfonate monooxygenase SsuD/methylene tetrahydromethanopterin reductase-like flavin-dependent oxidoreductase (luciferase family)
MQFGVVLHVSAVYAKWNTFLTIAKAAERLGYDSVWVSDHFVSPSGRPYGLESWTVLSALASSTHKIRLGTYVLCNQFRHPSLLAKMASTLDNVSKGRLELGIGAGWLRDEHVAFGFEWNRHSARIVRLRETLEIAKQLWTENHVSYDGKHFQLKNRILRCGSVETLRPSEMSSLSWAMAGFQFYLHQSSWLTACCKSKT